MSEVTYKNKTWLVKSQFGTYTFNNRKSAEQLNSHLNNYEKIIQSHQTEQTLDNIIQKVTQLQKNLSVIQNDLDEFKKEVKI